MRFSRRKLALVAVATMAATTGGCARSESDKDEKPQLVAAFIGDSYTAPGLARTPYWKTTAERMCWQPVPFGVAGSGYTIAGPDGQGPYVTRVDAVAAAMPNVVIVQGSFNDREPDVTHAAAAILFRSLHEKLPGARIFVMGPVTPLLPEDAARVDQISDAIRTAAEANYCVFIDARHFLADPALFGPDQIHPTDRGHQMLGAKLASAIPAQLSSCG